MRDDPEGFARDLARPMPRQPSPAARFGTRFHAWVESRFGQQQMIDPDELPGRGDVGIDDDDDLRELIKRFEEGPFADRTPYAVEPAFALVLAGQVVRGRIDAVYEEQVDGRDGSWSSTGRPTGARPPTRSSSRSTGWPGRSWPGWRRSGCAWRSTTCAAARPSTPDGADLPDRAGLERIVGG